MKKNLLLITILFLSFSSVGFLRPQKVSAAEGGPASPSASDRLSRDGSQGGPAGKLMLRAVPGPKASEVTLFWDDVQSVDNYHLVYGTDAKDMKYGVLNIGKGKIYTVKMLAPGTKYYFALVPVKGNQALYTSEWVSAIPASPSQGGPASPSASDRLSRDGSQGGSLSSSQGKVMGQQTVSGQKTATSGSVQAMLSPVVPVSGPVGKQALVGSPGPGVGEVTLSWKHADEANNYHLVYGTEPGKYVYGVLNIGFITNYKVGHLVPGRTYYFALVPVKNNSALYTTSAVAVAAKMNVQVVQTTPDAVIQPYSPPAQPQGIPGQ